MKVVDNVWWLLSVKLVMCVNTAILMMMCVAAVMVKVMICVATAMVKGCK